MTSGEHTKGCTELPWRIDENEYLRGRGGNIIADFKFFVSPDAREKQNLIITAVNTYPAVAELVNALEGAEEWLSGWASAEPYLTKIQTALTRFREAQAGGGE